MGQETEHFARITSLDDRLKLVETKTQLADAERKTMKDDINKLERTIYGDDDLPGLRDGVREMQKVVNNDILPVTKKTQQVMWICVGAYLVITVGAKMLEYLSK